MFEHHRPFNFLFLFHFLFTFCWLVCGKRRWIHSAHADMSTIQTTDDYTTWGSQIARQVHGGIAATRFHAFRAVAAFPCFLIKGTTFSAEGVQTEHIISIYMGRKTGFGFTGKKYPASTQFDWHIDIQRGMVAFLWTGVIVFL